MYKLLAVFIASLILAYISERNTKAITASGQTYSVWNDWAFIMLVVILTLFAGLRTSYNDTYNYIRIFNNAPGLAELISNPKNLDLLGNPLYYLLQSLIKDLTNNVQVIFLVTSLFTQSCIALFIKRYSKHFSFSIFLYFTLGTFCLSLAAVKQVMAMAILTLSIPYLENHKWIQFYFVVFIAMLMHTYAIAFAVLPLFMVRPWKSFTYLFLSILLIVLMNFQGIITTFLEQADEVGKTIADYEVFDNTSVNLFRIAVYAVPPLISLFFQKWVFYDSKQIDHVLVHMSIISVACMMLGTQSGANMFGRMANYFELGTVCALPWMLKQTFEHRSFRLISSLAVVCFLGYFMYANAINLHFDQVYQSVSILKFIDSLLPF